MTIKDEMKKIEGFKDRVICLASKIVGRSEVKLRYEASYQNVYVYIEIKGKTKEKEFHEEQKIQITRNEPSTEYFVKELIEECYKTYIFTLIKLNANHSKQFVSKEEYEGWIDDVWDETIYYAEIFEEMYFESYLGEKEHWCFDSYCPICNPRPKKKYNPYEDNPYEDNPYDDEPEDYYDR